MATDATLVGTHDTPSHDTLVPDPQVQNAAYGKAHRKPKPDAIRKRLAADYALDLCERFGVKKLLQPAKSWSASTLDALSARNT